MAVSALTGCAPDADPGPESVQPIGTTAPYSEPTETLPADLEPNSVPPPDEGCPDAWPVPLSVTTAVQQEVPYVEDMTACTDTAGTSTAIVNESDAVWTVQAPPGSVQVVPDSLRSQSFSSIVAGHVPPVLPPSATAYVAASPEHVTWTLAPDLSTGWVIHEIAADRARAESEAAFLAMVTAGTRHPARQAVATCTLAGAEVWEQTRDVPSGRVQALANGLGLGASGLLCRREWEQWRLATTAAADPPAPAISVLLDDIDNLERVSGRLTMLDRLGKVLTYAR